jgi:hypothetical protein
MSSDSDAARGIAEVRVGTLFAAVDLNIFQFCVLSPSHLSPSVVRIFSTSHALQAVASHGVQGVKMKC